jgi:hypothetical protein
VRSILIITPYDRESLNVLISKLRNEIKEFPIELQSPALIADYIYRNMDEQNPYSFFTCFLAGVDAYRNMADKENIFLTKAPLRFMIGASPTNITYDEIWLYSENTTTTHEEVLNYYNTRTKGELKKYLNIYQTEDATRKFTTFKGLIGAVSKELSKEIKGYGDL